MATDGFQFFTSDDVGAPLLKGQNGSLLAVLDWVLVSKGGWDKVYTGTNKAVYRAQTGNRFYLRVADAYKKASPDGFVAYVRGYENMTSVDAGTNLFPTAAQVATANYYVRSVYYAADTIGVKYWGIRTNRFFFIFLQCISQSYANAANNGDANSFFYFGDVKSLYDADTYNTVIGTSSRDYYEGLSAIWTQMQSAGEKYWDDILNANHNSSFFVRNTNGSVKSIPTHPFSVLECENSTALYDANTYFSGVRSTLNNFLLNPITLWASDFSNLGNAPYKPCRAYFPNLYLLQELIGSPSETDTRFRFKEGTTFSIGSKTFMPIRCLNRHDNDGTLNAANFGFAIEITDTNEWLL